MNEYCVTFIRTKGMEKPEDVFRCRVSAPNDQSALEVALRKSVDDNIRLVSSDAVLLRLVLPLPTQLIETLELVRAATHGATPTANPMAPDSHLH